MAVGDDARIVVTGLGCVSAYGLGVAALWSGLMAGRSAVRPERFTLGDLVAEHPAALLRDYDPARHFAPAIVAACDPFSQYALIAAREAFADAGLPAASEDPARTGVVLGNASGGEASREQS